MIPHVTNEVIDRIQKVARQSTDGTGLEPHICLIELGGTVGDIESMLFLEALRMLRFSSCNFQCKVCNVTLNETVLTNSLVENFGIFLSIVPGTKWDRTISVLRNAALFRLWGVALLPVVLLQRGEI